MARPSWSVALLVGFLSLAGTSASQQLHQVWVVNAPSQLQSAVDSAAEGDTVLVKASGDYSLLVQAKSLTIVADPPASVRLIGAIVRDLADPQQVELRGLKFHPQLDEDFTSCDVINPALTLRNNRGMVWIEDCTVMGGATLFCETTPGILVDACTDVLLLRTRTTGLGVFGEEHTENDGVNEGHGLVLAGTSRLVAHGCTFLGADGFPPNAASLGPNAPGAAGLLSLSTLDRVFLSDCQATGGRGEFADTDVGPQCSRGGPGISIKGIAWVNDSQLTGGAGSSGFGCSAPGGPPSTGTVRSIPGEALRLSISAPVREGGDYQLDFLGPPDTPTWLLFSPSPRDRQRITQRLLLEMPPMASFAGVTDAAGVLHLTRTMPALPPSLQLGRLYAQAFYLGPHGAFVLGGASLFLALDESF